MTYEHDVCGPAGDPADHWLDGIVGAEPGGRLHAAAQGHRQQPGRLLRAQLATVEGPLGPCARACEQAGDSLDLPQPRGTQRALRIDLLRDGIAVLDEIEPHGSLSLRIHLAPRPA
jgi:hypothetical protein